MEHLLETVTRGNVAAVKTVLTSVIAALAVYQVVLMAVGYGKLRLPVLQPRAASASHRGIGDSVAVLALVVAGMCLGAYGVADALDEGPAIAAHAILGALAIAVLALKVAVLRRWQRFSRWLPALGLSVFVLFGLTWMTSAGNTLAG